MAGQERSLKLLGLKDQPVNIPLVPRIPHRQPLPIQTADLLPGERSDCKSPPLQLSPLNQDRPSHYFSDPTILARTVLRHILPISEGKASSSTKKLLIPDYVPGLTVRSV